MYKRFIRIVAIAVVLTLTSTPFSFASDYQIEPQQEVIAVAKQFKAIGVLKQKDNGYLYVEVSNDYIGQLLPLIQAQGRLVPPRHYASKKGIGAHISVMYENERIAQEIWNISEIGQTFSFTVKELRTVKLSRDGKMRKLWLIAVEAPALERLREKYGLTSRLKGHDFHITLATQIPGEIIPFTLPKAA